MSKKDCYLFLFDGFSDWEPSLLTTGLSQYSDVKLKTFSIDGNPVTSMGKLKVTPEVGLDDISYSEVGLLVLPGGEAWDTMENRDLQNLIRSVYKCGATLAAICGATVFLGRLGYLNGIQHTSNHLFFLKQLGDAYKGEDWYVNKPCVTDRRIITANGTAIVDFAKAVFISLDVLENNSALIFWLNFFPASTLPTVPAEAFLA